MTKCNFCGNPIEQGTGYMYVKNDGKILYFCGSKCKKNMLKFDRKPIRTKWTKYYKKGK